ncbi:MAG: serine/threonine protein kinase [Phycisphaerales bacterium]|nr:serine/threonine protein kinase [Phycisphaerales bacterium]
MTDAQDREHEIFSHAMGLPHDERGRYLDEACGGDASLREQVDSLIEAMEQAGAHGFFDHPTGGATSAPCPNDETPEDVLPGDIIGNYTVLERIGEGGFGRVYRAEQTVPMKREVAIKIIKLGMDTHQVITRFEAERQALALMDHPAISTVFEAGATQSGRPYFVMELVRGVPITKYCDDHTLSIRDRLMLFREVCAAVQHAHQKSIIHRDIKPSNVLVADKDGRHLPKVIDFGVAKANAAKLSENTIHTQVRQLVGTPAYMSPEQAGGSRGDIDTRSDVYSLGVLLYELLTGATPLDAKTLTRSSYEDIQRMIREVTPPKPSTRLSTNHITADIAQQRHSEPRKLLQEVQGDLDWIVMKALEKDRARRYETVNALSDDIGRFLANEPVIARPPSRAYTVRKFVRRNRGAVVAGVALISVLLLGIAGTTWGLIWALDEREKARVAADDELRAQIAATEAAQQAASEAERATREAETAEELSRFFVMDVLSAADPARTTNKELTVREALINASNSIEGRFEGRPDFEMKTHNALGYLFSRLGVLDRAEHHHRQELALTEQEYGADSFETARIMHSVVGDLAMQERDAEAIDLTKRQLEIIDRLDTPEAAQLRLRVIGNLGALLVRADRLMEAVPILEETLQTKREQFGDRHPTTLATIEALATVMGRTGNPERSLELAHEAYTGQAEVLGVGDPRTLNSLVNLTLAQARLDQHEEAQSLLRAGIKEALMRLGEEHPTTVYLRGNYARSLFESGDHAGAETLVLNLLPGMESRDPDMLQQQSRSLLSVLASCQVERAAYEEALGVADRALLSARTVFPQGDPRLADYLTLSAGILQDLERFDQAEVNLTEAWACVDRDGTAPDQLKPVARAFVRLYEAWDRAQSDPGHRDQIQRWESMLGGFGEG